MTRKTKLWLPIMLVVLMVVCVALAACKDPHTCSDPCATCGKCTTACDDPACADKCDYKGNHPADKCGHADCTCENCPGSNCTCGDKAPTGTTYTGMHGPYEISITLNDDGSVEYNGFEGTYTKNGNVVHIVAEFESFYIEINDSNKTYVELDALYGLTFTANDGTTTLTFDGKSTATIKGNSYAYTKNAGMMIGSYSGVTITVGSDDYTLAWETDDDDNVVLNGIITIDGTDYVFGNVELDERTYFLSGDVNGWGTDGYVFTKVDNHTYVLYDVELIEGQNIKLRFNAATWNDGSTQYAYGGYFFPTDVFESSSQWDGNATVAAGKSGMYEITLITKGALTATTGRDEGQIESFTFTCTESFDVETNYTALYIAGNMNSWKEKDADWQLTKDADNANLWYGTFTFSAASEIEVITVSDMVIKASSGDKNKNDILSWTHNKANVTAAGKCYIVYDLSSGSLTVTPYYNVSYALGKHFEIVDTSIVAPDGDEYKSGDHFNLPDALKGTNAWEFAGWNDGTDTYPAGSDYEVKGNVTLTATWTLKVTWADWVGTYSNLQYDGTEDYDWKDRETPEITGKDVFGDGDHIWSFIINADSFELIYNGDSYDVELIDFNNNKFTFYINFHEYVGDKWVLMEDEEDVVNLYSSGSGNRFMQVDLYFYTPSYCAWTDYFYGYTDESANGVSVTRNGLYVTIEDKSTWVPASEVKFEDGTFSFTIGGTAWTLSVTLYDNGFGVDEATLSNGSDEDIDLYQCDFGDIIGSFVGEGLNGTTYTLTVYASRNGVLSFNGKHVFLNYEDCDESDAGFSQVILYTDGNAYYMIEGTAANDDGLIISATLHAVTRFSNGKVNTSVEYASLTRTDYLVFDGEYSDDERGIPLTSVSSDYYGTYSVEDYEIEYDDIYENMEESKPRQRVWSLVITADSITLIYNDASYNCEIIGYDSKNEANIMTCNMPIDFGAKWRIELHEDGTVSVISSAAGRPYFGCVNITFAKAED